MEMELMRGCGVWQKVSNYIAFASSFWFLRNGTRKFYDVECDILRIMPVTSSELTDAAGGDERTPINHDPRSAWFTFDATEYRSAFAPNLAPSNFVFNGQLLMGTDRSEMLYVTEGKEALGSAEKA